MNKKIRSVVLKNVEFWNGKNFESRKNLYLGNGKILSESEASNYPFETEIDANGALAMPALFGLSIDFMAP